MGGQALSRPDAEQQLKFLTNIQRLLAEGQFVATYKYALLLALADISIEKGDDSGDPLIVPTKLITEKFIQYYWRQVAPYIPQTPSNEGGILRQNTGGQAAIVKRIKEARQEFSGSLLAAQRCKSSWKLLVRNVDRVVQQMPLWKLQKVGNSTVDFLYENVGKGTTITLRHGVAYCFRQFHGLISDLVRGAWIRYIRRQNHDLLGTTSDFSEFLFGSDRSDLSVVRDILLDIQSGRCFYCERTLLTGACVDHFIPWSKYPVDLGHNFVVAHQACNSAKADHIASIEFLEAWTLRNLQHQEILENEFDSRRVLHDLPTSVRITDWAYQQTFDGGGQTWRRKKEMVPLAFGWRDSLSDLLF